jgi:hypothetical protein
MRLRHAMRVDLRQEGMKLQAASTSTNFNNRSDYAVSLIFLGKTKEAVELLQSLEQERLGAYFVAANLGTAQELLGNNEDALHWIREGILRNPESHQGTEWLHAKILEAKIAAQKDPDYFRKHSVLELDPQRVIDGIVIDGQRLSPKKVEIAIEYQLEERLKFVKPPDPAVASLLFDYAAIDAATGVLESAKGVLKMAVEYGYPADRAEAQIKLYDRIIARRQMTQIAEYSLLAIVFIALLVRLYQKGIFVLSAKDLPKNRGCARM